MISTPSAALLWRTNSQNVSISVCSARVISVGIGFMAARTMTGIDGNRLVAIDHARLQEMLRRHNRLVTDTKPPRSP